MSDTTVPFDHFAAIDIRVGTVVAVEAFPQARKPAFKLVVDFGATIGRKRSSAQITALYGPGDLVGRQVVAVVNLAPRQIGPFVSEVLVLGFADRRRGAGAARAAGAGRQPAALSRRR